MESMRLENNKCHGVYVFANALFSATRTLGRFNKPARWRELNDLEPVSRRPCALLKLDFPSLAD